MDGVIFGCLVIVVVSVGVVVFFIIFILCIMFFKSVLYNGLGIL